MEKSDQNASGSGFGEFYRGPFRDEHRHPANVALHVLGVLAGLVWLPATLLSPWPWLALLWPVLHVVPGLIGHRLFERNEAVGDLRVTRRDYSPLWFVAANHRMAFDWVLGRRAIDRMGT